MSSLLRPRSSASGGERDVLVGRRLRRRRRASRRRRAISLRTWSVMRRDATWISQPRGLSGTPSRGHCRAAARSASCTASSAAAKSPKRRTTAPSTCGASSRSRCSRPASSRGSSSQVRRAARSSPGAPRSACSSARRPARAPPTRAPRSRTRARVLSHVDDPVAGEELLGLRERPVGHLWRAALAGAHDPGLLRPASPSASHELARRRSSSSLNRVHEPDVRLDVVRRPGPDARSLPSRSRRVHHQHVLHFVHS